MRRVDWLYCSTCGCGYMSAARAKQIGYPWLHYAGEVCADMSGGMNTRSRPCLGRLEAVPYSEEILKRQRRSLLLPDDGSGDPVPSLFGGAS